MTENTDDDLCPFCGDVANGCWCDRCEEVCCGDCVEYRETHPATRIDPADGIYVCPECVANNEAAREDAEERAAENRAEARAADRAHMDDLRW